MARGSKKELTGPQKRVLDLLTEGRTVQEVADTIGIQASGVYGHMRRIKAAGHTVPKPKRGGTATTARRSPRATARRSAAPTASSNGNEPDLFVSLRTHADDALKEETELLSNAERAREDLGEQIEAIEAKRLGVVKEIEARKERIAVLDKVKDEVAGAPYTQAEVPAA